MLILLFEVSAMFCEVVYGFGLAAIRCQMQRSTSKLVDQVRLCPMLDQVFDGLMCTCAVSSPMQHGRLLFVHSIYVSTFLNQQLNRFMEFGMMKRASLRCIVHVNLCTPFNKKLG